MADTASRPLSDRVVFLCLADLELSGSAPTHTGEVVRTTKDCLDAVDAETLGRLSEAEVNRAINRLEADGLVGMADGGDRSPAGKGRPSYALAAEPGTVLEGLAADDSVARLAGRVAGRT
jgi:hypothetical protein